MADTAVAGTKLDGVAIGSTELDAIYIGGLPFFHSGPRPVIERFQVLPNFLLRSAGPLSVVNFDFGYTPADATAVVTDPSGLAVANGLRAPALDTRFRLRVTEIGKTPADAYFNFVRALEAEIVSFTADSFHQGQSTYTWQFHATIRAHPRPDSLTITGTHAGQLRGVSARQLAETGNEDEYTASWAHAVGGSTIPDRQVFTLAVSNQVNGNQVGSDTATLSAPA